MSLNIRLKHSAVQDKAPLPADLEAGELAVNTNAASPAIYMKNSAGTVLKVAGPGSISTSAASETEAGIAELATQAEVTAGTDDARIVTPLKLKTVIDALPPGTAVSGTAPATPDTGQQWYNTTSGVLSIWDGAAWQPSAPPSSQTAAGVIELATQAEVDAGVDDTRSVTPAKLAASPLSSQWTRTGTELSPKVAGDSVFTTGEVKAGGTTAAPNVRLAADGKITAAVDASIYALTVGRGAGAVSSNTAVGNLALQANTIGYNNSAIGCRALYSNTTGYNNSAIGYRALYFNTTGYSNNSIGYQALYSNTTGISNSAVGRGALYFNTTGYNNTAVGNLALYSNTTGYNNNAVGLQALYFNTTGSNNNAVGLQALYFNTTGSNNSAIGYQALYFNTTGISNSSIGRGALYFNTTGSNNSAIGTDALKWNGSVIATDLVPGTSYTIQYIGNTGDLTDFTLVGAADNNVGTAFTATGPGTGSGVAANNDAVVNNNTALGCQAGFLNSIGTNNTFIGYQADGATPNSSNTITLGNASITALRCQVTTITALSDERDKADIIDLDAGLDFINQLRPVSFTWNTRDGAKVGVKDAGFIAQELLSAQTTTGITIPNLVSQANPDRLEAGYGTLIPVLVNAVQELTTMVKDLQSEIATLKGAH